jgi:RNA polymerase sigma factor (TIGR02999 family)
MNSPAEVTQILQDWRSGDNSALNRLMPLVYNELRQIASRYLRRRNPNQTLQTTALVHEAYMRLVGKQDLDWQNRAHFFGIAAKIMRGILLDYVKTQQAEKRGGSNVRLSLDEAIGVDQKQDLDIVTLNDALNKLSAIDERKSRIVELRFFAGLGADEIAEALSTSPTTVTREWKMAKAWLRYEMGR